MVDLHNYTMVLKRKRDAGNLLNSKYKKYIDRLSLSSNFLELDPNISASRLIYRSEIVISLPFTATAIIAKKAGKASIYYDPSGIVQKDDRAAHGIEIVSGFAELNQWFMKINKN
jgi:polysaccharide biosynthesis PFTS motif protein